MSAGISALLGGCAGVRGGADASSARDDTAWIDRLTWGTDGDAVAAWSRLSRRGFIDAQLQPGSADLPPAVQARVDALGLQRHSAVEWVALMVQRRRDADALNDVEARRTAQRDYQQELTRLAQDAAAQFLYRALYSPQQLREQLVWFWFNHFNVHQYKGSLRALVGDYQAQLRVHALGRFQDLLIASATHPAMLVYLDNDRNASQRLNENYAREVMELHTLGVDGGYSQRDVQELARVLTGLGVNFTEKAPKLRPELQPLYRRQGATEFNPARHDMGAKQVLGFAVEGGGWSEIIDQLVRLARHPATARHVSHRLAVYFCDDAPAPALVDRMSNAFIRSDGRIDETLRAMFEAPAYAASLGMKFKDPVHYVVSAVRLAYDGRLVSDTVPVQAWINRLGEGLYNRQTPDGYPLDEAAWSASGQMRARFDVARAIGQGHAALFAADAEAAAEPSAAPQWPTPFFEAGISPRLRHATRDVLASAASPEEGRTLFLSSPDFMYR